MCPHQATFQPFTRWVVSFMAKYFGNDFKRGHCWLQRSHCFLLHKRHWSRYWLCRLANYSLFLQKTLHHDSIWINSSISRKYKLSSLNERFYLNRLFGTKKKTKTKTKNRAIASDTLLQTGSSSEFSLIFLLLKKCVHTKLHSNLLRAW